ncbi:MAG: HDOD domain-containing protein [Phycisphaerae bacterium]
MPEDARQTPPEDHALTAERLTADLHHGRGLSVDVLVAAGMVEQLRSGSAQRLCMLASADAALAGRLLSAARKRKPHIADLTSALDELGADGITAVVLSAPTWRAGDSPEGALDRRKLALHCLAVATAASGICEKSGSIAEPRRAWLWGLMHDIGKLALAEVAPKSHARACDEARLHADELAVQERRIIGLDHAEAGRRLAETWRLDEDTTRAIWLHHQPSEALPGDNGAKAAPLLIQLADTLARQAGMGDSGSYSPVSPPAGSVEALGISEADLAEIRETLADETAKILPLLEGDEQAAERTLHAARLELAGRQADSAPIGGPAGLLLKLAEQLDAASGPADVLTAIVAAATAESTADVVAYAIEPTGKSVLFVRLGRDRHSESRILPAAEGILAAAAPGQTDAESVAGMLLADADALTDFAAVAGLSHQPLGCGEMWTGGVFAPAEVIRNDFAAAAPVMGLLLALTGGRSVEQRRGEELAAAGRMMGQTRRMLDENRTLAAIAEMAAGAAHEINTPLAVISGRAQWMVSRSEDETQRRTWQTVSDKAQQVSDVVTALMEYAQPPEPRPEAIDPGELLASVAERFSQSQHPQAGRISVDIETGEEVPAIWADRSQLSSALVELLSNAATAAGETDRRAVRLWAQGDATGERVVLAVSDAGGGMDPKLAESATTPFYCSQQAGRRRGLGLSMAKRYAEINAGSLKIATAAGAGTTVRIELPAAGSSNEHRQQTTGNGT